MNKDEEDEEEDDEEMTTKAKEGILNDETAAIMKGLIAMLTIMTTRRGRPDDDLHGHHFESEIFRRK